MGKKTYSFMMTRIFGFVVATAGVLAISTGVARADSDYPTGPVRIIVPFSAGGSTDQIARSLADGLGKLWKKPVVIENREGANGTIGARVVSEAKADGYTLLFGTQTTLTVMPYILPSIPYDADKDFSPITELVNAAQLLSVPKASKFNSLKDLIDYAKAHPGELNYGGGYGATTDMAMRLLMSKAGVDLQGIPYKGSALAMNDLLGGRLDTMFDVVTTSLPHVQSGGLRALAVTSESRFEPLPDVPTVAEQGYPGFKTNVWFGLFAPAGTPADIIQKISDDSRSVLNEPERKKNLTSSGFRIVASEPAAFTKLVEEENKTWSGLVKAYNMKMQ